ncbi:PIN domain-containing protein [Streptomyces sp. NPDC019826]|uniref:PIN domain-containing protein n=1 Tax=Streptomyces TaxID=1883 RepID=UPI0004C7311E|nr:MULTISPECIES: PIN domain-containing protein [Streptomyces]MCY1653014.1 PIN domain-containing protein [Streptomyces sp. SL203]MCY1679764.1 PIN domain-containing protein [Streptomyces sp. SL294]WSZ49483.1 PIN domain-containing protein [[Kitasatospora] papulosa]
MIIVADTSALYAAFDSAQPERSGAAKILEYERLAISPLVLTELDHLVHRDLGFPAAMQVMEALNARITDGQYRLADLRPADLVAAHTVRRDYGGLRLDLADAVGVVLADRYRTDRIFTLDRRDFRAITPLTPGLTAFRILPVDG